jgi:hypothetical protein
MRQIVTFIKSTKEILYSLGIPSNLILVSAMCKSRALTLLNIHNDSHYIRKIAELMLKDDIIILCSDSIYLNGKDYTKYDAWERLYE